jgi:hypothetical protein
VLEESFREVSLEDDGVGSCFLDCAMEPRRLVGREGDEAEVRIVLAQPSYRADAVEARHVQVDDDCIRDELVDVFERFDSIRRLADDDQSRPLFDQSAKRGAECGLVIREQYSNRS